MAEHKSQSPFPYIAIVAIVAVVAVVVLVLNFSGGDTEDTALVVDEEGNLVGEAFRSRVPQVQSAGRGKTSGSERTLGDEIPTTDFECFNRCAKNCKTLPDKDFCEDDCQAQCTT